MIIFILHILASDLRFNMQETELLVDLLIDTGRQGPGGEEYTRRALDFSNLRGKHMLKVADLGCGNGASSLVLAEELDGTVMAVDQQEPFLKCLQQRAAKQGLAQKIKLYNSNMAKLPFARSSFDLFWAEASIHHLGLSKALELWRPFLKNNGYLIFSDLCWLGERRPEKLQRYWDRFYPSMMSASHNMETLEQNGFSMCGYFVLPEQCWLDNYYQPLQQRFEDFLQRHEHCESARQMVRQELDEMAIYRRYHEYYGYAFYVARKIPRGIAS